MFFPGLVVYYAAESQGLEPMQGGQESTDAHNQLAAARDHSMGRIGYPALDSKRVGT